jgi:hypothetical protein
VPRTHIASLTLFGLIVASTACKPGEGGEGGVVAQPIPENDLPEASAATLCELLFGCACENVAHPDEATCVETWRETTSADQLAAQEAGLTYDAQCAGNLLAMAEANGCAPQVEFDCSSVCAAYHGQQGPGEPCTVPVANQPSWSDCAQGLWCFGTCEDLCGVPQDSLGEGDACRDEDGQPLGQCDFEANLFCDFTSNTCIALPGPGEPCYAGELCAAGAMCDWSGTDATCVPLPGEGETCTFLCASGFYCDIVDGSEGSCVGLPGEGQPCSPQGQCAADYFCDGDVCEALPAWVCGI